MRTVGTPRGMKRYPLWEFGGGGGVGGPVLSGPGGGGFVMNFVGRGRLCLEAPPRVFL